MSVSSSVGAARRRLMASAASRAFAIVPSALIVGVSLAGAAQAGTVNPVQATTYNLTTANNPITFGTGAKIDVAIGDAVYGSTAAQWNVTNEGALTGQNGITLESSSSVTNSGNITGSSATGIGMNAGGAVVNQSGGVITGATTGLYAKGGATTVTNAGTVTGTTWNGVGLFAGGSVDNQSGGKISGGNYGVYVTGGDASVTNAGSITGVSTGVGLNGTNSSVDNAGSIVSTGKYGFGVNIKAGGGTVTNETGGYISSARSGVVINGGAGTVTNAGVIQSTFRDGVFLGQGGQVTNNAGGSITGNYGVLSFGDTTLTNAGAITGTAAAGYGVAINGAGTVNNGAGGAISGGGFGVYVAGGPGSVTNAGSIKATGVYGVGVALNGTGSVTNQAGGYIGGTAVGVVITGDAGAVTNSGAIQGTYAGAALIGTGGQLTNNAGGTITGGYAGVFGLGSASVTNAGAISATNAKLSFGVALDNGGAVANQAGGAISGDTGVYVRRGALTLTNAGAITGASGPGVAALGGATVTNQTGGSITGATVGLYVLGGATVTNAGAISGATDSIVFAGAGANTLTLDTGSSLTGDVIGSTDAAATNDLVLQGAGEADNRFVNFNTLTAQGSGAWVLGGTSTIGSAEVDSGMLVIDGSLTTAATTINGGNLQVGDAGHAGAMLTSPATVNAGGTLSGHGTVVGEVTNNGGVVAPGGSVGTLTIAGDYTQSANGTLAIQLTPAGSSRLLVTGTAHLDGALLFSPISGVFRKGQVFDFLDAGAIDGAFSTITFNGPQIFTVSQGLGGFTVTTTVGNFALQGGTLNQRAIVPAFNNYPVGTSDFDPVANAIIAMSPGAAQNQAVNALGSEISPDLMSATRDTVRGLLGDFTEQLASREGAGEGGSADPVWVEGIGRFGSVTSDGNAHGFSDSAGGIAGGVQRDFGSLTAGGAVSWQQTWLSLSGLPQSGNVSDTSLGLYGEQRFGNFFADVGGLAGFQHGDVKRLIAAPGVATRQATGAVDGLSYGVIGRIGDRLDLSRGWTLEPRAGLAWSHVEQDGYSEAGAGGANLDVASTQQDSVQSLLGVRVSKALGAGFSGEASLDWAHEFDDLTPRAFESFSAVPGDGFTIAGVNPGKDAAVVHAGLDYKVSRITVYGRYDGSFSNRANDSAVTGGLKIAF